MPYFIIYLAERWHCPGECGNV